MHILDPSQLSDEQRRIVQLPASGHHVVTGVAGSGKTSIAAHRAHWLGAQLVPLPSTMITFSRTLANTIGDVLDGAAVVRTFHAFARAALRSIGEAVDYQSGEARAEGIRRARVATPGEPVSMSAKDDAFIIAEIGWIQQHGIRSLDEYQGVDRIGRGIALGSRQRSFVWALYERYWGSRPPGLIDFEEAGSALLLAARHLRRPQHLVVDEAQDLGPEAIRALAALVGEGGSLTVIGDMDQQIYGRQMSFASLDVVVRSRVHRLLTNHRTSPEIARLAAHIQGFNKGGGQMSDAIVVGAPGPDPELRSFASDAERLGWAADVARVWAADGRQVAVLVREAWQIGTMLGILGAAARPFAAEGASGQATGIVVATAFAAKGHTFDVVVVPFAGTSDIPPPATIRAMGAKEAYAQEARLLYVAATRARHHVALGAVGPFPPMLPAATPVR